MDLPKWLGLIVAALGIDKAKRWIAEQYGTDSALYELLDHHAADIMRAVHENLSERKIGVSQEETFNRGCEAYSRQDFSEARRCWEIAARKGDDNAMFNLGLLYDHGAGVARDEQQAFRWYEQAAEKGNAKAQYNVAISYKYGSGVQRNSEQAIMWFTLAAEQGLEDAKKPLEEMNSLKSLELLSKGHEAFDREDYSKAVLFWKRASQSNAPLVAAEAQYLLARVYKTGVGVEENREEARRLCQAAAEGGIDAAVRMLAELDNEDRTIGLRDRGTAAFKAGNFSEALSLLIDASKAGDPSSAYLTGLCYRDGLGCLQDWTQAVYWLTQSADRGIAPAQTILAYAYGHGKGVSRDITEALRWCHMAVNQNFDPAKKILANLEKMQDLEAVKIKLNEKMMAILNQPKPSGTAENP